MKIRYVLLVLVVLLVIIFLPSYSSMQDLKAKNAAYLEEIQQLEAKKEMLIEEKRKLLDDPVYLEKVAREKMGVVREGEVVYKMEALEEEKE